MVVAALKLLDELEGEELVDDTCLLVLHDVFVPSVEREDFLNQMLRNELSRQQDRHVLDDIDCIMLLLQLELLFVGLLDESNIYEVLLGYLQV